MQRADAERLDGADPLRAYRDRFVIADPGLCYLDGNSLGRLPRSTVDRLQRVVAEEWGRGLVRSWDRWIELPTEVGDRLAGLLGAPDGSVLVADSVTVNLYKVVVALLGPGGGRVAVAATEFPTDRYVLAGLPGGATVDEVTDVVTDLTPAHDVVVASVVDFRTAALLDVTALVEAAQRCGTRVVLDLSHAAGAVPVDLSRWGVDAAVGCTYKYLCGGPGAPGYLYVRPGLDVRTPIQGWFAQQRQFSMEPAFDPLPGAAGFAAGTPPVLSMAAVDEGVRMIAEAGVDAAREKSVALTEMVVDLVDAWLRPHGVTLASPRDSSGRGGHVSIRHPEAGPIGVAARAAGVVPDVRPPDLLRLAPAPLSTSFVEVWDAMDRLRRLFGGGDWTQRASGARVP